tara:strand:- start:517 stop:675 length:159 start_codon:yes stop_codon:yes gene_type:complete
METRILAENIIDNIVQRSPAIGKLLEEKNSYENIVDLIKDLLDEDLQLKDLE